MRLSAELLESSEQRTNALGEREIILRGLAIPALEHLGVTRDAFDAMDFTDNRVERLENFPRLTRLSSLCMVGNVISTLDPNNLSKNTPNLTQLDLSYNQIASLFEVSNLGRQHYRLYTIQNIPSLKVLDFLKITKTERERAERLAKSAAGAALEADVQGEQTTTTKTFTPGEGRSAQESFVTNFTKEEKELIRVAVANAKSPTEIEDIERSVQRGILPAGLKRPPPPAENNNNGNGHEAKKAKVDESGES